MSEFIQIHFAFKATVVHGVDALSSALKTTVHGAKMALAKGIHRGIKVIRVTESELYADHLRRLRVYLRTKASDADSRKNPLVDAEFYVREVPGHSEAWAFHVEQAFSRETTPSLDRIDPLLGYDVTNLRWISRGDNLSKGRTEDRRVVLKGTWHIEGVNRKYKSRAQAMRGFANRGFDHLPKGEKPSIYWSAS